MKLRTLLTAIIASLLTAVVVSQAQVPGVNSALNTVFTLAYDNSTMKPSYSAAGLVTATASTTGDICAISGSATKTIKVRRVILGGTLGAVETIPVAFLKRSTAYAGAGVQPTVVPYDSANAAGTAVVETWATSPTAGTLVGMLADVHVTFPNTTTGIGGGGGAKEFIFGQLAQPVVLRGVAQQLGVSYSGTAINTAVVNCTFEWTEE